MNLKRLTLVRKMGYRNCCLFRIKKRTILKGFCFLVMSNVVASCLLYSLGIESSPKTLLSKADFEIEQAIGSRETPSAVYVLPDKDTTIYKPRSRCTAANSSVFILFMVVSAPSNTYTRDIFRTGLKTYLDEYNEQVQESSNPEARLKFNELLFFTGLPGTVAEKNELIKEAQLNRDLIVDDFQESYLNLTLKSMRLLKWVERYCNQAKFTVKIDDDFHVNLAKLLGTLEVLSDEDEEGGKNLIAGDVRKNHTPIRDPSSRFGKYYVPLHLWPNDVFPEHVTGSFYVLGVEARRKIYVTALRTRLFPLEDIFLTGIVAKHSLGMNLTRFSLIANYWTPLSNFVASACQINNYYFGVHFHWSIFNYLECWKEFNSKHFSCDDDGDPLVTYCWV